MENDRCRAESRNAVRMKGGRRNGAPTFVWLISESGGMNRSDSQVFLLMLLANETYSSFAPLRMTRFQFVVILSRAKDLYVLSTGNTESECFQFALSHPPSFREEPCVLMCILDEICYRSNMLIWVC